MNITGLNLRDLAYLVAVARYRHFGKAAKACHVSQPALSGQIKKIENLLGVTIFERDKRSVAISDVGQAIVQQARIVIEEAEKIVGLAKATTEPLAGAFRLGAIATLGPYLMPHLLGPLRQAFPKLELILKEGLTDGLLAELRAGAVDAVLAARTFDETGLTVIPLFKEPFLLTAPNDHPLATKTPLTATDLKASEMVLLEDGHCLRDETIAFCAANRRGNIKEFHVTSLETLRHLVASGAGYTLMPMLAVNEDERLRGLVRYRKLGGKDAGRTIVLACRDRSSRKRDVEALAKFIRKHLPRASVERETLRLAS